MTAGLFDIGADWAQVEAPSYTPVAAGIYEAELGLIEAYSTKDNPLKKGYIFPFRITEDEANDGRHIGREVREYKFVTNDDGTPDERGMGFVKARLEDLGVPKGFDISKLDPAALEGITVALTVVHRPNPKSPGDVYVNVTRVQLISGPPALDSAAPASAPAATPAVAAPAVNMDNPFA